MAGSSSLLLDEALDAGDERFLPELFAATAGKKLKSLADRWYGDARPFARRALLHYIDDGCDRAHHRPLVKALYKLAEAAEDDEAMGHFLVAFDRLAKRSARTVQVWDRATRQNEPAVHMMQDPKVPERLGNREATAPHFSRRTRRYLRRRAWRYFRALSRRDVPRYGVAIRGALALYRDEHLATPAALLDAWGLMHALYKHSPVLTRDPKGIRVTVGRSLSELEPSPHCPEAWSGGLHALLDLVGKAGSRTVRVYAIAVLRRDYEAVLRAMPVARIRPLLRSPHDEVQTFAAELLRTASGVHNLSVAEWLELLRIDNPVALPLLCELVGKFVSPGRLDLAQCVELACARAAPVAELGLGWAKKKSVAGADAPATLVRLAQAEAEGVRREAIDWVITVLEAAAAARDEHLRELFDARYADVRERALGSFQRTGRFKESMTLWGALAESPYDDVRGFLVAHLKEREASFAPETLRHLWATILLAVHRGGRAKRGALDRVAQRVVKRPEEAGALLPLLGIALRSVRPAERRTALAAVARAAFARPALRAAIARDLPEIQFEDEVAVG